MDLERNLIEQNSEGVFNPIEKDFVKQADVSLLAMFLSAFLLCKYAGRDTASVSQGILKSANLFKGKVMVFFSGKNENIACDQF